MVEAFDLLPGNVSPVSHARGIWYNRDNGRIPAAAFCKSGPVERHEVGEGGRYSCLAIDLTNFERNTDRLSWVAILRIGADVPGGCFPWWLSPRSSLHLLSGLRGLVTLPTEMLRCCLVSGLQSRHRPQLLYSSPEVIIQHRRHLERPRRNRRPAPATTF